MTALAKPRAAVTVLASVGGSRRTAYATTMAYAAPIAMAAATAGRPEASTAVAAPASVTVKAVATAR